MTQIHRWLVRTTIVLASMLLGSCATMTSYIPEQNSVKAISVREARNIVEKALPGQKIWFQTYMSKESVLSVRVKPGGIAILTHDNSNVFLSLENVKIHADEHLDSKTIWCRTVIEDGINTATDFVTYYHNNTGISQCNLVTNALLVLSQSEARLRTMEDIDLPFGTSTNDFDATAKAYRDASPKPILPESARRFRVEAEGAINDKQFENAADFYEQAIEIAPWWPEGHFNRAIVLAETGNYSIAIIEMKRYLALVPNAPDARAAQDKIYDWERKADKSNN